MAGGSADHQRSILLWPIGADPSFRLVLLQGYAWSLGRWSPYQTWVALCRWGRWTLGVQLPARSRRRGQRGGDRRPAVSFSVFPSLRA